MRARETPLAWIIIALSCTVVLAQFEYRPFSGKPNPRLARQLRSGRIDGLFRSFLNDGTYEDWATSTLKAQGRAPARPKPFEQDGGESLFRHVEWTCMYSAYSAMDRKPQTAWAPAGATDGIGEIVVAQVDTRKPVRIWAGYGKSRETFANNNRPRKVRLYLLEGRRDEARSTERGDMFSQLRVVGRGEVMLQDRNGYQPLPLPAHSAAPATAVTLVAVEVLSVYRGRKHRDTCISEIGN